MYLIIKTLVIAFLVNLVFLTANEKSLAQVNKTVNLDSLMISGIYKVTLIRGYVFEAEVLSFDSLYITFTVNNEIYRIKKDDIKSIEIPGLPTNLNVDFSTYKFHSVEMKFTSIYAVNVGICFPTGRNVQVSNKGFEIEASFLHHFDRIIGVSTDFQFIYLPAKDNVAYPPYYYGPSYGSGGTLTLYTIKANFLVGSFRPESKILLYGDLGVGTRYAVQSDLMITSTYYDYTNNNYYTTTQLERGNNGTEFIYGIGLGASYRLSPKLRLYSECQFNSLSDSHYYNIYEDDKSINGILIIKAGIMFTNF